MEASSQATVTYERHTGVVSCRRMEGCPGSVTTRCEGPGLPKRERKCPPVSFYGVFNG